MTVLAVDIGNSRVKAGLFREGAISAIAIRGKNQLHSQSVWDDLLGELVSFDRSGSERVDTTAYCQVDPGVEAEFLAWARGREKTGRIFSVSASTYPFPIDYDDPNELGGDRLADGFGGYKRFGGPLAVVDFGTAVTVNVIGADGRFLGGAIAPGARLMTESLARGTALLPSTEADFPPGPLGKSTGESIAAAVTFGIVAMVDGLIDRYEEILECRLKAVATGGSGERYCSESRKLSGWFPYLTLEGVAWLALEDRHKG